jgi:hypothetical protein
MLMIFFNMKGIVYKEFNLASQTVSSSYCCDVLRRLREIVLRLRPELCRQKSIMTTHLTLVHPSYFSLFPQLKIKLKDRHFDTIAQLR